MFAGYNVFNMSRLISCILAPEIADQLTVGSGFCFD